MSVTSEIARAYREWVIDNKAEPKVLFIGHEDLNMLHYEAADGIKGGQHSGVDLYIDESLKQGEFRFEAGTDVS